VPLTITERIIIQKGFERGVKKGKLEAKGKNVINPHRELQLPPRKTAKVLKVSEEFVREVLNATQGSVCRW